MGLIQTRDEKLKADFSRLAAAVEAIAPCGHSFTIGPDGITFNFWPEGKTTEAQDQAIQEIIDNFQWSD